MNESALDPRTFWHFIGPPGVILHNARLSKGIVSTPSTMSRMPGMELAVSSHDINPMLGHDAEQLLERIRQAEFPAAASRNGAIFLFDDRQIAEGSARNWLRGAPFEVVRVRVALGSKIHRGSLGWLDNPAPPWEDGFRAYWRGEMSPKPPGHWEYVVDGVTYFPDWEEQPFGRLMLPRRDARSDRARRRRRAGGRREQGWLTWPPRYAPEVDKSWAGRLWKRPGPVILGDATQP